MVRKVAKICWVGAYGLNEGEVHNRSTLVYLALRIRLTSTFWQP